MSRSEVKYLCYRCYTCGRLITKYEIYDAWDARRNNLCPCGSGKIAPTNPKVWEELLLPRCWKVIWKDVLLPKLRES